MASLAGRVIAITGAASGMGHAFARLAASHGAKLALADIQKGPLEDLASKLRSSGSEVQESIVDVSSCRAVDDWIEGTIKHFGRLDSAANIAGIIAKDQKHFVETSNETWDRILGVNLYGVMHCVRAQLRVMQEGATIVNYASVLGTSAQPGQTVYSISKHGVIGLTRGVARELTGKGIRINAIAPGVVKTAIMGELSAETEAMLNQLIPLGRWGQAEEVAKLTAFLLSEDSSYMHGHVTYIDGGYTC